MLARQGCGLPPRGTGVWLPRAPTRLQYLTRSMVLASEIKVVSSTPFVEFANSQQASDEMVQGETPWTMSHAGRIGITRCGSRKRTGNTLLAKPEPSNRRAVPLDVLVGQIRQ